MTSKHPPPPKALKKGWKWTLVGSQRFSLLFLTLGRRADHPRFFDIFPYLFLPHVFRQQLFNVLHMRKKSEWDPLYKKVIWTKVDWTLPSVLTARPLQLFKLFSHTCFVVSIVCRVHHFCPKQDARVHEAPQASHDKRTRPLGWHRNCFQTSPRKRATICIQFPKRKQLLWSEVSSCNHWLARTPKEAFSEVTVHTTTIQVDFEVYHHGQPPANSPPGDHLITIVKETLKKSLENMKRSEPCSYLSKI